MSWQLRKVYQHLPLLVRAKDDAHSFVEGL